jgi:predicted transcriptional regulator
LLKKSSLIRWAHIKIAGGKGRHEIPVWEFFKIADAKRVVDLAFSSSELSVKENDSVQAALDKMLDYREDILPVVDDDKRIVGDLSLSDILAWIQINGFELKARRSD